MERRKIIIHKHLFKNAGTTFDWILENNFGTAFCDHRDDTPMRKEGERYLIQYLDNHPQIKALSSHHIWFRLTETANIEFIPICFLRHPIERIRSVYNFEKQQNSTSLGARMAKKMDFKGYVDWRMREDVPDTIRNFQTRMISGLRPPLKPDNKHLQIAITEIQNHVCSGVIEYFDRSLQIFDRKLKENGISLDFLYSPKNVFQPYENDNYEDRILKVIDDLGDTARIALENNQLDVLLYQTAKRLVLNENLGFEIKIARH